MAIADLLFPKFCLSCKKSGKYICQACLSEVPSGKTKLKDTYVIFSYQGVIKKAIHALKYKYTTQIAQELANAAYFKIKNKHFPTNPTLVPIPLHPSKLKSRGFNHTAEIGKLLANKMHWQYEDSLIKTRKTRPQATLTKTQRQTNLKNAFKLKTTPKTKNIILFDDVLTTGNTLTEARKPFSTHTKIYKITLAA